MKSHIETDREITPGRSSSTFLQAAVVAAMALAMTYFLVTLFDAITSDSLASPLELEISQDSITSDFPGDTTIVDASARVDVDTGLAYRLAWWAVTDALAIVGVAFLELLRRILATRTDPFVDENVARLRWMSALAVLVAVIAAIRPAVSAVIQDQAGFDGFEATWDLRSLVVVVLLVALTEVWRDGASLRSDRELTI